jgi:hypothetical protein
MPYSTNLSTFERLLIALAWLTVFLPTAGALVALAFWLYLHATRSSGAVHALQAVLMHLFVLVTVFVLGALGVGVMYGAMFFMDRSDSRALADAIEAVYFLLVLAYLAIVAFMTLVLWGVGIWGVICAIQNRRMHIPYISRLAERLGQPGHIDH